MRDRFSFRRRPPPELIEPQFELEALPVRFGSSLSLGGYVQGLTPVLVEMGQQGQPEARRAELHRMLVRTALERLGMA